MVEDDIVKWEELSERMSRIEEVGRSLKEVVKGDDVKWEEMSVRVTDVSEKLWEELRERVTDVSERVTGLGWMSGTLCNLEFGMNVVRNSMMQMGETWTYMGRGDAMMFDEFGPGGGNDDGLANWWQWC